MSVLSEFEQHLRKALEECARLREENDRLRALLSGQGLPRKEPIQQSSPVAGPDSGAITNASSPGTKLALFRRLFRGREDVYAVRWESKDGKSGYSPAGIVDWKAIRAAKPAERKKVARETRSLLPLTDEAVRDHLLGKQTVGIYPLLPDETCWLLAVDFDKKCWMADAAAFAATCRRFDVPVALERSRSGKGAHAWLFFDRPVLATDARRLGCALLTRTTEDRHEVGLDSYDRLFPNQDTMPKGGFGNLIALPLQKIPRDRGNSVFLNEQLEPGADQWEFLGSMRRILTDSLAGLIHRVAPEGNVVGIRISLPEEDDVESPWALPPSRKRREKPVPGPLPANVRIVLSNLVYVEKKDLPSALLDRLIRIAAFQNPEFYKAQAMRRSTYGKPRIISCAENFPEHVALPRGCLEEASAVLSAHGIEVEVQDERRTGQPISVSFQAELLPDQEDAIRQVLAHDIGIIDAPTAFGKTVVAIALIARRATNALVLVHRRQLMDQWRQRLSTFLSLPLEAIGQIGGGQTRQTSVVDVAVIQSLQRKGEVRDLVADYGQIIVDECHHLSAFTFEQVLKQAKARYIVGLTATPVRKDGHHPIIHMQCGPIRFSLSAKKAAALAPFEHSVFPRLTAFQPPVTSSETTIHDLYSAILHDEQRNRLIVDDLRKALLAGRSPLVLTGRTEHLVQLVAGLADVTPHLFVLKGGQGKKQRLKAMESLAAAPEGEPRVILATGSYIGEGFDDARLDTLFLAMPISWRGTLQQYVGRLHRLCENKKEVQVYDYVDSLVPMLDRMYQKRAAGYRAFGYTTGIMDAGSPAAR